MRFADGSGRTSTRSSGAPATGSLPLPLPEVVDTAGNKVPLYRRVVHRERPGLYFIGLVQPLGAIMPIAEPQSEWVADLLEGRAALPTPSG